VNDLLNKLKDSSIGVICLTPDNLTAPFIHFEAGALLAQDINKSRVCVYLYNLKENDVEPPLNMFQLKRFEKKQTLELLHTINNHLGTQKHYEGHLNAIFENKWDKFEKSVQDAINNPSFFPSDSEPIKWIQVAGSGNINNPLSPDIVNVCNILGRKLAQHNFGLLTANWPLVDEEVTKAYASERENMGRTAFVKNVLRGDGNPNFTVGEFVHTISPHTVWGEQALLIDACVLIGGEGGTLQTALWMSLAEKPVFPLAKTGGDAEKYFWACREEPFKLNEKIPGLTKNDFHKLNNPIPGVVDDLIELLDKWAKHPKG
jgi:hypothetical protein